MKSSIAIVALLLVLGCLSGCIAGAGPESMKEILPDQLSELELDFENVSWLYIRSDGNFTAHFEHDEPMFDSRSRYIRSAGVSDAEAGEIFFQGLSRSTSVNARDVRVGAAGVGSFGVEQHGPVLDVLQSQHNQSSNGKASYGATWSESQLRALGIIEPVYHQIHLYSPPAQLNLSIEYENEPLVMQGITEDIHLDQFSAGSLQAAAVVGAGGEWRGQLATNDTIPIIFFDPPDTDFAQTAPRQGAYYFSPDGRRTDLEHPRGAVMSSPSTEEWIFGFDGALDPYRPNWPILSIAHIPAETGK